MTCPDEFDTPRAAKTAKGHGAKRRRGPRKATKNGLENAALHYLGRFASSAENLRRVLMRRVTRSARHHGTDPEIGADMVDDIIRRYRRAGLLDDRGYAEARARDLHRRGTPLQGIRFQLRRKGVGAEDIDATLADLASEWGALDTAAAVRLARRRRLGPFRPDAATRRDNRDKDLAAMARAGFDYDTAKQVIDADDDAAFLIEHHSR